MTRAELGHPLTVEGDALLVGRIALLRLLQVVSGLFPVGAFAYSGGLEARVAGEPMGEEQLGDWLGGLGAHLLGESDLPLLRAAHRAWSARDLPRVEQLSQLVLAQREAAELRAQEVRLGRTFARALGNLGVPMESLEALLLEPTYLVAFALGSAHFQIPADVASLGYAFAWCEQQVSAAARLLPIGHAACQRVLSQLLGRVPDWVEVAQRCRTDELGLASPGLGMLSAWHEGQYSRLFLS